MTFLHGSLLPLAALAVVPVLLHLLSLHRLRTVELSTYRFLFDTHVQERRKMKFLEALLGEDSLSQGNMVTLLPLCYLQQNCVER